MCSKPFPQGSTTVCSRLSWLLIIHVGFGGATISVGITYQLLVRNVHSLSISALRFSDSSQLTALTSSLQLLVMLVTASASSFAGLLCCNFLQHDVVAATTSPATFDLWTVVKKRRHRDKNPEPFLAQASHFGSRPEGSFQGRERWLALWLVCRPRRLR